MSTDNNSATLSSALSELLLTGRTSFQPENTRFVCHTSTIPLCTIVDEQFILANVSNTVEVTHSIKNQPGLDPSMDYRCCKTHCMYVNKNRKSSPEILRSNCPCGKVVTKTFIGDQEADCFLQPVCFLQLLKESRYDFGYKDASECDSEEDCCHNDFKKNLSNRPRVNLADVMYCQNSQSITDSTYSRPLRNVVGFDGWLAANSPERIWKLMETVYWFRKYSSNKIRNIMAKTSVEAFMSFKSNLEQTLHTVNGQITKKLLLFPCEMEGYTQLAKLTAQLFEDLLIDYLRPIGWKEPTVENSIFLRMKEIMKNVKRAFSSSNREIRMQCFSLIRGQHGYCKFSKFWQYALKRLERRVISLEDDYTTSIAWINSLSGFAQTRNLGYLPTWIAVENRKLFRETVGREKTEISMQKINFIKKIIRQQQYKAGIEEKFLQMKDRDTNRDFRDVINSIKIPLKPSASIRSTVHQGGKVEDARQLLNDAMMYRWKIPVRDFDTGRIIEYIQFDPVMRETTPEHEGYLFWVSFQLVINWLADNNKINGYYKKFKYEIPNSEPWIREMWMMTIIHISEPGKERNLTKTSSVLAWVLTVCSKVSQMILSFNQDHRAGLVLSAQDWMHQRRVSSESYESTWMYNESTRKRYDNVWNGFQDWTESTDHIPRQVGATALSAWFGYIAFPRFYGSIVSVLVLQDYTVSEYIQTDWVNGKHEKVFYHGKVTEGFMMSMPLTKTILHLMHDLNIGTVNTLLKFKGVKLAPRETKVYEDLVKDRPGQLSVNRKDVE